MRDFFSLIELFRTRDGRKRTAVTFLRLADANVLGAVISERRMFPKPLIVTVHPVRSTSLTEANTMFVTRLASEIEVPVACARER